MLGGSCLVEEGRRLLLAGSKLSRKIAERLPTGSPRGPGQAGQVGAGPKSC